MKNYFLVTSLLIISLSGINAQNCDVLVPELVGEYIGECRRGQAHGEGKAVGTDIYEGEFRNGLPHGEGTYSWSTGEVYTGRWRNGEKHGRGTYTYTEDGEKKVQTGVWTRGEFSRATDPEPVYRIIRQRSVDAVRVLSTSSEGSTIVVKITRSGMPLPYSNLAFSSTSGQQRMHGEEIRFEHVTFPVTISLRYNVQNALRTASFNCELEITIETPGSWDIITSQ